MCQSAWEREAITVFGCVGASGGVAFDDFGVKKQMENAAQALIKLAKLKGAPRKFRRAAWRLKWCFWRSREARLVPVGRVLRDLVGHAREKIERQRTYDFDEYEMIEVCS